MELYQDKKYIESLCKLHLMLVYEADGNFTKFNEIVYKSGMSEFNQSKYFVYNLMQALSIQGVIDLVWLDRGITWIINNDLDNPSEAKSILGCELLTENSIIPTIFFQSVPLAYKSTSKNSFVDTLDNVSPIGCVSDHVLFLDTYMSQTTESFEMYCIDTFKWVHKDGIDDQNMIIRVKEKFSGYKYFLFISESRSFFKVLYPEWLFVVGAYICDLNFRTIININKKALIIPASFRLPKILNNFLFQNCESISLGFQNQYSGVCKKTQCRLLAYLVPGVGYE